MNIRLRLALVCGLFSVPLVLVLYLYGHQALGDFTFNARELQDAGRLKTNWASLKTSPTAPDEARIQAAFGRALILDDHADAYRLAEALNASLLNLAVGDPDPRLPSEAATSLSEAADSLPPGPMRGRLLARADELRAFAATPQQVPRAQSARWWTDTLSDLEQLLTARREAMMRRLALEVLFIAIFSAGACLVALSIARGISRRVATLTAEIDRLIHHDTEGATPFLGDVHEIGQIAKGVEALRQALIEARGAWSEVLMNEMRYSLLAENMRDVVLLTDLAGQIAFASPSASHFGPRAQDLEATSAWDLFEAHDAVALKAELAHAPEHPASRSGWRPTGLSVSAKSWDLTIERGPDQDETLLFLFRAPG